MVKALESPSAGTTTYRPGGGVIAADAPSDEKLNKDFRAALEAIEDLKKSVTEADRFSAGSKFLDALGRAEDHRHTPLNRTHDLKFDPTTAKRLELSLWLKIHAAGDAIADGQDPQKAFAGITAKALLSAQNHNSLEDRSLLTHDLGRPHKQGALEYRLDKAAYLQTGNKGSSFS